VTEPSLLQILSAAGAPADEVERAAAYILGDPHRAAEIKERAMSLAYKRWPALYRHPELIQLVALKR